MTRSLYEIKLICLGALDAQGYYCVLNNGVALISRGTRVLVKGKRGGNYELAGYMVNMSGSYGASCLDFKSEKQCGKFRFRFGLLL